MANEYVSWSNANHILKIEQEQREEHEERERGGSKTRAHGEEIHRIHRCERILFLFS